jgi:hypothetical protein
VVDEVPRESGGLSLVALLLLHPSEEEDLDDDYAPQDAPDYEDSFQGIPLDFVSLCPRM